MNRDDKKISRMKHAEGKKLKRSNIPSMDSEKGKKAGSRNTLKDGAYKLSELKRL